MKIDESAMDLLTTTYNQPHGRHLHCKGNSLKQIERCLLGLREKYNNIVCTHNIRPTLRDSLLLQELTGVLISTLLASQSPEPSHISTHRHTTAHTASKSIIWIRNSQSPVSSAMYDL